MTTTENATQNDSKDLEQLKSESSTPNQERELIDDAFYLKEQRWGLWDSFDKNDKGLVTSLTKEACINATRFYLKGRQEGWDDSNTIKHEGTVGGKL